MGNLKNLKKEAQKMGTQIVKKMADWVRGLVSRPTRHADNLFHAQHEKLLRKLHEAQGNEIQHSVLLKRMKTSAKNFQSIVDTLKQQGDIEIVIIPNLTGRAKRSYRLTKGGNKHGSRIA